MRVLCKCRAHVRSRNAIGKLKLRPLPSEPDSPRANISAAWSAVIHELRRGHGKLAGAFGSGGGVPPRKTHPRTGKICIFYRPPVRLQLAAQSLYLHRRCMCTARRGNESL
jgi:hypothetical protein